MNKLKNIYKSVAILGLMAVGTTSCEDWLTIHPTDRVVEEEYWEDKNDLDAVRYGAYKQMASTVRKLAVWGDLRSDSYNLDSPKHSDKSNYDEYDEIMKGLLDSSMSTFEWNGVYTTINYCNKVLQHGPEVLEKDKQFTTTEWYYIRAEMKTLRALNYFYLLRTFKDIPYTTATINSDAEVQYYPLTNQLQVLDSLILDVETIKGQARNRFTSTSDSKGMITNCAVYSLLADMYLWRAALREGRFGKDATDEFVTPNCIKEGQHGVMFDYEVAAAYADKALASLHEQTTESESGYGISRSNTVDFGLTNCDLIKNEFESVSRSGEIAPTHINRIFSTGNSVESIFELQYSSSDSRSNPATEHLYGHSNGTLLQVSEDAIGAAYGGWGTDPCLYDTRAWVGAQNLIKTGSSSSVTAAAGYYCMKYNYCTANFTGQETSHELKSISVESSSYRNWIIYRTAEVMLIKAEALASIGSSSSIKEAINLCAALRRRAYCNYKDDTKSIEGYLDVSDKCTFCTPYPASPSSRDAAIEMVMNERQIELLGEGKRWYDLVRYAERYAGQSAGEADPRESTEEVVIGNGQKGVEKMVEKYLKNAYQSYYTTLKNRFKNRYGLYSPIYYKEIQANYGVIEQNPVWNKSKYQQ